MALDRMTIGRFSLITRLPIRLLRLYDRKGILVPEARDLCTGYRYYSGTQLPRGVAIRALGEIGFSPAEIAAVLAARERGETAIVRELFGRRQAAIRSEIHRLRKVEAILDDPDASAEMTFMSQSEPIIKEVAPIRVLSARARGAYETVLAELADALTAELSLPENRNAGLKVTGPYMTMYYDPDYREEDADVECAVPIGGRVVVANPAVEVRVLPGGRHLSITHQGSFGSLAGAWTRLLAFAEEQGYEQAGPIIELNLNDPAAVPEGEILVELQLPIR